MANDIFSDLGLCRYCSRPGITRWDADLISCSSEVCEALAFAELRRRYANHSADPPLPVRLGDESRRFTLRVGPRALHTRVHVRVPKTRHASAA
jgi:hypothetical protein